MWETIPLLTTTISTSLTKNISHYFFLIWYRRYLTLRYAFTFHIYNAYTHAQVHTLSRNVKLSRCLSAPPTVSGFSYYQFYCFQDTENLFNRFDSEEDSLTDFLNSTETLSARLCVQTEVFRSFISSQLPWFRYQKETWLAIGEMQCPTLWCAFLLHGWYIIARTVCSPHTSMDPECVLYPFLPVRSITA